MKPEQEAESWEMRWARKVLGRLISKPSQIQKSQQLSLMHTPQGSEPAHAASQEICLCPAQGLCRSDRALSLCTGTCCSQPFAGLQGGCRPKLARETSRPQQKARALELSHHTRTVESTRQTPGTLDTSHKGPLFTPKTL